MKKVLVFLVAGFVVIGSLTSCAQAIPYKQGDYISMDKENVAGGEGTIHFEYTFTRDMPPMENPLREIAWVTLKPGVSLGFHKHEVNEEVYAFISGTGIFTENDGSEIEVGPGDMTVTRLGQSHAVRNEGTEDLVFIAVIAGETPQ